jgi:hypothetical protein
VAESGVSMVGRSRHVPVVVDAERLRGLRISRWGRADVPTREWG